ncbi:MAG: hypothetical protein IKP03_08000 [Fibrobacter sp.]|uniref:hypothetical protein n=1 Tax=uncultured Fibrobacter sp. TaxID=261512 RepID=UPI0025E2FE59|nr:hypothetical protein [uncultured Fibrobacter sp.]MBR4681031.1 hypothetical protein [Fibrobacter sp.]
MYQGDLNAKDAISESELEQAINGMDEKLFVSTYKLRLPDREQLENFLIKEVKEMGL